MNFREICKDAIPVITGPTASGKSDIAFALARRFDLSIVSCDSRQIYRGMDIGTAKPSLAEQAAVPHHLIDIADPDETYSLYRYSEDAVRILTQLQKDDKGAVICGGTGLYLRALIDGVGIQEESDPDIRDMLTERSKKEGCLVLHGELMRCDPVSAMKIHSNDAQRIIRALSVFIQTGKPLSSLNKTVEKKHDFRFRVVKLNAERGWLYSRINRRVDKMVELGLYDEFRRLVSCGFNESSPGMQCVGYREFFAALNNSCTFKDAVELIKRNTRRFAKRQITWFAHQQDGISLDAVEPFDTLVEKIENIFSR